MDQNEEVNSINSDLIRGHIDTIILKALEAGDRYGYDIIKEIEHKSDGQYIIKQPTLYSCLKRLEVQGFVKSYWGSKSIGGRKKYFTLTDLGRELFDRNKSDWNYSRNIIDKLISDDDFRNEAEPTVTDEDKLYTTETDQLEEEAEQSTEDDQLEEETEQSTENEQLEEDFEQTNEEEQLEEEAEQSTEEQLEEESEQTIEDEQLEEEAEQSTEDEQLEEEAEQTIEDEQLEEEAEQPIEDEQLEEEAEQSTEEQLEEDSEQTNEEQLEEEADEEPLPLSAAEQSYIREDNTDTDYTESSAELDERLYDNNGESYLTNADNAEYEPPAEDIIDVDKYFDDIPEEELTDEEDYDAEEEAAASVAAIKEDYSGNDGKILPPPEEEDVPTQRIVRNQPPEGKAVFYSYNRIVPEVDEKAAIIDKEYRGVINQMIEANVVNSVVSQRSVQNGIDYTQVDYYKQPEYKKPEPEPQPQYYRSSISEEDTREISDKLTSETGERIDIRTHDNRTLRSYNNKHYYYCNQLRLLQCGILFGIMLLEIIICFYTIEVVHNSMNITKLNLAFYIIAVVIAALLPITSFCLASSDYYKRKRINYSGKSSAIFSVAATILLSLIVFFANVYGGILSANSLSNYLTPLIMPIVLSTNVIVNAIIFHLLYTSGKYNIEE